ncbi:MAG: sugar ABC transporter permease [Acholeplasmataceae bacterium]|jgi:ABC-type sugar transport system permease subunit|nr:sugar ABC transporter permease [Acholeplasmataceae bacterium]
MKLSNRQRENLYGYLFIGIWIIGFLWLTLYPLIMSFIYSLNKVTITAADGIVLTPIKLQNYVDIFSKDFNFVNALTDFIGEIVLFVPIIIIMSIIIALLLNQKIRLRGVFRSIFFLPVIIASGPMITELIRQGAGTVPIFEDAEALAFVEQLPRFLANPILSLFSKMIIVLWFSGVQIVLFLAALQKVDSEIYEAASIDGASPWEMFWKITLPTLKPTILISSIYTIVFLATFSSNSVLVHIQNNMFDITTGYGYSSALAWIYFVVISILLGIVYLLFKQRKERKEKKVRRVR